MDPTSPSRLVPTLSRVLGLLVRPPFLTVFAVLNAIAVLHAGVAYLLGISGPVAPGGTGEVISGDYLAFLTGARMIADGHAAELYDFDSQLRVQERIAGVDLDAWQPYVNPPLLALALRPLAGLDFGSGFQVFGFTTIGLAALGLWAFSRSLPTLASMRLSMLTIVSLGLGFPPLAATLPGRQNAPVTLALLGLGLWALQRRWNLLAGILVGLLGYKPQFLLPVLLLLAWCRAWSVIAVAVIVVGVHYLAGAWLMSPDWPIVFVQRTAAHAGLEWTQNGINQFSLLPFFRTLVPGRAGTALGVSAMVVVAIMLARALPRDRPGDPGFPLSWTMAMLAGMLISPYLQYYEFGLLVLPVAAGIEALHRQRCPPTPWLVCVLAAAFFLAGGLQPFAIRLGFQPLALLAVGTFGWLCWIGNQVRREHRQV